MPSIASIFLLQSTLALLSLVQANPVLPQSLHDQAIVLAQKAIVQASATSSDDISASFSADTLSGTAPLTVNFSELINMPSDFSGSAIVFFGDTAKGLPTSDVVTKVSVTRFQENWSYVYRTPGEYDAYLVLTSADPATDLSVRENPLSYKNFILQTLHISVH